jgi:hypothetical protein
MVRLKCKILEDGSVAEMVAEDGLEQLLPLARAALARWRYEPVRFYSPLTGKSTPVPVITTIDLRFDVTSRPVAADSWSTTRKPTFIENERRRPGRCVDYLQHIPVF